MVMAGRAGVVPSADDSVSQARCYRADGYHRRGTRDPWVGLPAARTCIVVDIWPTVVVVA